MTRTVRLCASMETLLAYRAAKPTMAQELAAARARVAELEAEVAHLREQAAALLDLGLTPVEARILAALQSGKPMTASEIATAASTARQSVNPASVKTLTLRIRKTLDAAKAPWTVEGVRGGRWSGGGWRLVAREVAP